MNNTVENNFGFPKVKWLHLTCEVDKPVVDGFWDTVYKQQLLQIAKV